MADRNGARPIAPKRALTVRTDAAALRELLWRAPHEATVPAEESTVRLVLPLPDGAEATFSIVAYDIAEPAGLAAYPGIRTWYGVNVAEPRQTIFLDWTLRGFHAAVRGGGSEAVFVDPVFRGDTETYQVYRKSDFDPAKLDPFTCQTLGENLVTPTDEPTLDKVQGECELMQYRTTITATGEYSNYHGATSAAQSALVQSAVVTSVNRVNQVTTRDISLRLQLVGNNDLLYNYDPATDPFPSNSVGALLDDNTPYVNGIIGSGNYDYGHIYTQGQSNGVAYLRASCGSSKAGGATSLQAPEGDPFDIDYVAHEMGHNFGGNHTQNNSCNYSSSAGMEPGSASSIMGYAGICSPNVQNNSDAYFHGRSIEEMTSHIEFGSGGCGTIVNTSLSNPTINQTPDRTIPGGTPFVLTSGGSGNGTLTYNWEQYDSEQGSMPPQGTNAQGPLFRSRAATAGPDRYFPRLSSAINVIDETWEKLPTVNRQMEFRATQINQNAAYGCAQADNVTLSVQTVSETFTVTDPDQGNQWSAGQTAQVQWDVAGTTAAPFSSATVDILYTDDDGATLTTLVTDTPNDGYAEVTAPSALTTTGRIVVRSHDNYFYNVTSRDFSIVSAAGAPGLTLAADGPTAVSACNFADDVPFRLYTNSVGGATAPVSWTVSGLPSGVSAVFDANPTRPGGLVTFRLTGTGNLPSGTTNLQLTGSSTEGQVSTPLSVTLINGTGGAAPAAVGPSGTADDLRPVLRAVDTGEDSYDLQLSTQPTFGTVLYEVSAAATPELTVPDYLTPGATYYWRVRANLDCGTTDWGVTQFTVTADCQLYSASGNVQIGPNGSDPDAELSVAVPLGGTLTDVDVYQLDLDHTYLGDLEIYLRAPGGAEVRLFDQSCGSQDNMFTSFDDEADGEVVCPPTSGDFIRPDATLAGLDGTVTAGDWTIRVDDRLNGDQGTLNGFQLKLCLENAVLPVTWLDFTAAGRKDYIALNWSTADERANAGFTVERTRADGPEVWTDLGFVPAGDGTYAYDDRTALANVAYLYRLRQRDTDGRVDYSPVRAASFGATAAGVIVFPNPTGGTFRYRLGGGQESLPYELRHVNGQLIGTGVLRGGGGTLDLSGRPAGVYLLRAGGRAVRVVKR